MPDSTSNDVVGRGRTILTSLALGLSGFLVLFDVTAVVVAMPAVEKDLGLGVSGLAWLIDAYSVAFAVALLASGALADRFGRLRCMLIGNAVFLAASIACGMASNEATLLASRALQGLGAAFMATGGTALLATCFPDVGQRTRAFGIVGTTAGIAMAIGPTVGGVLASWFGWRWIFLANIPFCLALAFAVPRLVTETSEQNERRLDPIGIALFTIALGLTVEALLGRENSLAARATCLLGGAVGAFLFLWQQSRSPRPVLDLHVLATPAMIGVAILLTAVQFGYWAVLVYLPLFLTGGLHMNMEMIGTVLLTATLPMLLVPLIGGHLAARWGWRRLFVTAFGLMVVGDASLVIAAASYPSPIALTAAFAGMMTTGVGAALANPQLSGVMLAHAPATQTGMVSAITFIVRQVGFAISIAALGTMLGAANVAAEFTRPFILAALVAMGGMATAFSLVPTSLHEQIDSPD